MDETDPVADWMRRCVAGDAEAQRLLFDRYAARLARLAGQHLSQKLAARVDQEDVALSAFRTFFRRTAAGEFAIDTAGQLWGLLTTITVRKTETYARRAKAKKRTVDAEVRLSDPGVVTLLSREPDPAAVAGAADLMAALVAEVPPLYARVLELRLQGVAPADVARDLNISRNTVYRAMELFKERLAACDRPDG